MLPHYLVNINARKLTTNDKLQGSVATYLRCGGDVSNIQISKSLLLQSASETKLNLMNIWRSYKQDRCSFVHFVRLANTLLKDEESARDNHLFACNFAKYSPTQKKFIDVVNCIGDESMKDNVNM